MTAACANEIERSLVGLSMLVEGNRWIELQSISLDGGDHRELLVRQYERLADAETLELGFTPLELGLAARAATARAAASGPLDVDDVLEASERAPVEIVEAAILESNSLFALDSAVLIRLVEAGVEERVIDLMVAISYPDQLAAELFHQLASGGGGYAGYGGYRGYATTPYYGYYAGSCWGPYYGPMYGPYGPGCDYRSPYYGYYQPYYGGGGGGGAITVTPSVPPTGSLYGGKVIRDRGYVTVTERPRTQPSSNNGISVVRRAFGRDAFGRDGRPSGSVSGAGIGSSSGSSSRGSVSRNGFRRSGSSGGSSSGGSSSGGSSG